MNINTQAHWEKRFTSGDWSAVGGNEQTKHFAEAQAKRIRLSRNFRGTLVDFGCGEGDALPVFKAAWPHASCIGIDFSQAAIAHARMRHGDFAEFMVGDHESCPCADVIIASNVMEHLDDDIAVASALQTRCRDLYIIVPFEEQHLIEEHVRRYDKRSFSSLEVLTLTVFACRGWSHYGFLRRMWQVYAKNLLRPLFGRAKLKPRLQAMYHIQGALVHV
jgi:hypothetical protein